MAKCHKNITKGDCNLLMRMYREMTDNFIKSLRDVGNLKMELTEQKTRIQIMELELGKLRHWLNDNPGEYVESVSNQEHKRLVN
jgi:hypothetical protein